MEREGLSREDLDRLTASLRNPCSALAATLRDPPPPIPDIASMQVECLGAIRSTAAYLSAEAARLTPGAPTAAAAALDIALFPVTMCLRSRAAPQKVVESAAQCMVEFCRAPFWDGKDKVVFAVLWRELAASLDPPAEAGPSRGRGNGGTERAGSTADGDGETGADGEAGPGAGDPAAVNDEAAGAGTPRAPVSVAPFHERSEEAFAILVDALSSLARSAREGGAASIASTEAFALPLAHVVYVLVTAGYAGQPPDAYLPAARRGRRDGGARGGAEGSSAPAATVAAVGAAESDDDAAAVLSRATRAACLGALRSIWAAVHHGQALAQVLPGVTSACQRLFVGPAAARAGRSVCSAGLDTWCALLVPCLVDAAPSLARDPFSPAIDPAAELALDATDSALAWLHDAAARSARDGTEENNAVGGGGQKQQQQQQGPGGGRTTGAAAAGSRDAVISDGRDAGWSASVDAKVARVLDLMCGSVTSPNVHASVRLAAVRVAESLVDHCRGAVPGAARAAVAWVAALIVDPVPEVRLAARRTARDTVSPWLARSDAVAHAVVESLRARARRLPRDVRALTGDDKCASLRAALGHLRLACLEGGDGTAFPVSAVVVPIAVPALLQSCHGVDPGAATLSQPSTAPAAAFELRFAKRGEESRLLRRVAAELAVACAAERSLGSLLRFWMVELRSGSHASATAALHLVTAAVAEVAVRGEGGGDARGSGQGDETEGAAGHSADRFGEAWDGAGRAAGPDGASSSSSAAGSQSALGGVDPMSFLSDEVRVLGGGAGDPPASDAPGPAATGRETPREPRSAHEVALEDVRWVLRDLVSGAQWSDLTGAGAARSSSVPGERARAAVRLCLTLRCVAACAAALGRSFDRELPATLYAILEQAEHPWSVVRGAAEATLREIAAAVLPRSPAPAHGPVAALIAENLDYLVDAIAARLRHFEMHPRAASVLRAVLRLAPAATAADQARADPSERTAAATRGRGAVARLIDDSVLFVLDALDATHGTSAAAVFQVLSAVAPVLDAPRAEAVLERCQYFLHADDPFVVNRAMDTIHSCAAVVAAADGERKAVAEQARADADARALEEARADAQARAQRAARARGLGGDPSEGSDAEEPSAAATSSADEVEAPKLPQHAHRLWPGIARCVHDPRHRAAGLVLAAELHRLIGDDFLAPRLTRDVWPAVKAHLLVEAPGADDGAVRSSASGPRAVRSALAMVRALAESPSLPLKRIAGDVAATFAELAAQCTVHGPAPWAEDARTILMILEDVDPDATYLVTAEMDGVGPEPPRDLPPCIRPSPLQRLAAQIHAL